MFRQHKWLKILGLVVVIIFVLFGIATVRRNATSAADQQAIEPANNTATHYRNNLALTWTPATWSQVNQSPKLDLPIISQNESVYTVQNVSYAVAGSTTLALDLYSSDQPVAGGTKPIVVYVHGGGMIGGTKNQLDRSVSDALLGLLNNGFIVASINYQEAPAARFPAQIQDVVAAMRFVRYYAYGIGGDQNKIGLFGDSVGGQLAALTGVTNGLAPWENSTELQLAGTNLTPEEIQQIPSRPNAVVDYYGGTELPPKIIIEAMKLFHIGSYFDPFSNKTYAMSELYQVIYDTDSTLLHESSAINYVAAGEPPILIVQGDKDELTPPNTSKDFYNKLKSYGNDATLIMVKNAEHRFLANPSGATIDPSYQTIISTTVSFFKTSLR